MAIWQVFLGGGIGLIAAIAIIIINSRPQPQPKSSKSEYYSPPGDTCAVCFHSMSNSEMLYLSCGHAFHQECVNDLRKNNCKKCPTCRKDI